MQSHQEDKPIPLRRIASITTSSTTPGLVAVDPEVVRHRNKTLPARMNPRPPLTDPAPNNP